MNTDKIYAEQLANEYAPKDTSKVVALRKLDAKAKLPATIFTYTFGIIAALIFGTGMCLAMGQIGSGTTGSFVLGIVIGIIGMIGMGVNYPIYKKLRTCPTDELYLVTPEYLTPYLSYIRQHHRLFRTATENAQLLGLSDAYDRMCRHVFSPILERFGIPEADRAYRMAFYIHGLMAIIAQWLKADCADPIAHIIFIMQTCVMPSQEAL